ncbi:MAG: 50S ribosomal protein L21e [Candidatus Nanoarchaeia archaeon]
MVKRAGTFRSRTRYKLRKPPRDRGKVKVTSVLQTFEPGEKVIIHIEPSVHKGMPHPKFKGRHGIILEKVGNGYKVAVRDGGSQKILTVRSVHLLKAK